MATKEIPYGLSDYARLALENYYYVDKTHFIPLIEKAASFFFLIRPRRFGKSLTLSMLESYYDINNANRFEELFVENGGYTNILQHCGQKFLILRFNFSAVSSNIDRMLDSFEEHCKDRFIDFADRYETRSSLPASRQELMERETAASGLSYINTKASFLKLNLYLIIDEYDNFQHHTLHLRHRNYQKSTHGEGFFRFFFNVIKSRHHRQRTGTEANVHHRSVAHHAGRRDERIQHRLQLHHRSQFNGIVGFKRNGATHHAHLLQRRGTLKAEVEDLITMMKPLV